MGNISIAVRRQPAQIELPYVHPNHFVSVSVWPSGGKAALAAPHLCIPSPSPAAEQSGGRRREAVANKPGMAGNTQESR